MGEETQKGIFMFEETIRVRRQVAEEFGFHGEDGIRHGMEVIRSALATYPGDKEIINAANYIKFNRCFQCEIPYGPNGKGAVAPGDMMIHTLEKENLPLKSLFKPGRVTILCGASWT